MSKQLLQKLDQITDLLKDQNVKLDKLTGLMAGNQLLTECVDYHGKARGPEECADIVLEGFSAALCLMSEIDQRNREYQYQKQEFFIETEDDEEESGPSELNGIF